MSQFAPQIDDFEARIRATFARQPAMATIGVRIVQVAPGEVTLEFPFRTDLTQQHGFLHAGIVTTVCDTACGVAALSLMPADTGVLTVEYKVNFLAPAAGERFIARGRVVKPGQTITVCSGEVVAVRDGSEKPVALMQATMMTVRGRQDVVG